METLISIEHIVKKNKQGTPILSDISAKIMDGELITIIGPSGSGKSTFLSLINRMADPDSGSLYFRGTPYHEIDVLQLRRKIGIVFQLPTMLPGTVRDNLFIGPALFRESLSEAEIDELLDGVGLPPSIKEQNARSLSGGQKQRVSLARTLANRPDVLLLDEVTASLDPHSTEDIENLIEKIHQSGKTILWVTHNLSQAKKAGQFTWVFANGKIIEQGRTIEIFSAPKQTITKEFIETSFAKESILS
ncbi:ABC transporter ATP-binding protein [Bacillus benzoevorans]|uniref:Putative ABC transport system ATP-binding protein n=1 Tax=Bacillus benzoevorans TaxID=1456 RepID=A0A7X0HT00_9BACI|nr:phosphate ABC transporter ATP-binding protein [Bacillus benzoevorans]MBB6445352.1 putative ABC transport system ATP-binding protein [Bacillus benzoevorans]